MKTGCVTYIDPYYSYNAEYRHTGFLPHEACGYLTESANSVLIEFVKQVKPAYAGVIRGLIIPLGLVKSDLGHKVTIRESQLNQMVRIEWDDVTLVSGQTLQSPSRMVTKGHLQHADAEYVIITDPHTVRESPLPKRDHPARRARQLFLPRACIVSLQQI